MEPFVWSARSQRSVLEERQLEENLESCRQLIKHFSKHIENFEKVVEFQTTNAIRGDGVADHLLPTRLLGLQSLKM